MQYNKKEPEQNLFVQVFFLAINTQLLYNFYISGGVILIKNEDGELVEEKFEVE